MSKKPNDKDRWGVGQMDDGSINVVPPDELEARVAERDAEDAAFGDLLDEQDDDLSDLDDDISELAEIGNDE